MRYMNSHALRDLRRVMNYRAYQIRTRYRRLHNNSVRSHLNRNYTITRDTAAKCSI